MDWIKFAANSAREAVEWLLDRVADVIMPSNFGRSDHKK